MENQRSTGLEALGGTGLEALGGTGLEALAGDVPWPPAKASTPVSILHYSSFPIFGSDAIWVICLPSPPAPLPGGEG